MVSFCDRVGIDASDTEGRNMSERSIVYFTRDLSAEGLRRAYEKIGCVLTGKIGVKLHTGEPHGPNIIPAASALLTPNAEKFLKPWAAAMPLNWMVAVHRNSALMENQFYLIKYIHGSQILLDSKLNKIARFLITGHYNKYTFLTEG
jgi:hypothetical protein